MTSSTSELQLHRWSLHYLYLKLVVCTLRLLNAIRPYIRSHSPALPEGFERIFFRVPSREAGRNIRTYIHQPIKASNKPRPVHISFHGSGFVLPNLGEDNVFIHEALIKLGPECIVIDADYRKAPECPFPAAVHDAHDVVKYVLANPHVFDTKRISLGGFSAGGNLALVVGCIVGPQHICAVTSLYPPTDFTMKAGERAIKSTVKSDSGIPLPVWLSRVFTGSYFVGPEKRLDPRSSVYLQEPKAFPRVLLASGEVDTLHHDSEKLIKKLKQAGNVADFIGIPNEGHGFDKLPRTPQSFERRAHVYKAFLDFIRASW